MLVRVFNYLLTVAPKLCLFPARVIARVSLKPSVVNPSLTSRAAAPTALASQVAAICTPGVRGGTDGWVTVTVKTKYCQN